MKAIQLCLGCDKVHTCTTMCDRVHEALSKYPEEILFSKPALNKSRIYLKTSSRAGKSPSYRLLVCRELIHEQYLTNKQRKCLWLKFVDAIGDEQIARQFSVSRRAVTATIAAALKKVDQSLISRLSSDGLVRKCAREDCTITFRIDLSRPDRKYCSSRCSRIHNNRMYRSRKVAKTSHNVCAKCKKKFIPSKYVPNQRFCPACKKSTSIRNPKFKYRIVYRES